jgi:hypothetical protein
MDERACGVNLRGSTGSPRGAQPGGRTGEQPADMTEVAKVT